MIITGIKAAWALMNEPRMSEDDAGTEGQPLWELFRSQYLGRHGLSVVVSLILASMTGLWVFVNTWATRKIVDDVVEVQFLKAEASPAVALDPSLPAEHRRFALDQPRERSPLRARIEQRQARTVPQKLSLLGWVAVILILSELFRHGISLLMMERTVYVGQHVAFRLRRQLHDKLHRLPLSYHDRHSPGRLMTHLFSDVGAIQGGMTDLLRQVPPLIVNIILGLAIVLAINPRLSLLVLAALPAYWACYRWFKNRLRTVNENLREREGRLNAHIANRISSFHVVKSFVREVGEGLDFLRRNRPIIRNYLSSSMLSTGFVAICGLVTGTCTTLVLWLGALEVRDGRMSAGQMLMFWAAAGYLFQPIASLTNLATLYHRLRTVAGKIMRVMHEPVTLTDPDEPLPLPARPCEVRLEDVSLCYDPQRPPALDGVSLVLPPGKKLCIMGPSGSGKTTLAKLICRLYDPTGGRILFNGTDVRRFPIAELRKFVGFVPQEPIVFRGTIGDNIRYGSEDSPHSAVIAAAQFAQIHDFIDHLPERYRTLTHERGLTLSGGQKQRVNLARALLYDPRVMVLDDCTSALDAQTEARLVESFRIALHGRTAVLVSHRVSVAMECDLVMVLDAGRMVEMGPPHDLLHGDGPFAELHRRQFRKAAAGPVAGVALSGAMV